MKLTHLFGGLAFLALASCNTPNSAEPKSNTSTEVLPTIVIHGGAGYMTPETINGELEQQYIESLNTYVQLGNQLLNEGMEGALVVEQVIRRMESDSLFNAGFGAVLTAKGEAELDASIMRGSDLQAGAISGVKRIEHPISLALRVLDSSKHVMLSGSGAEEFARSQEVEFVDNSFFITTKRSLQYKKILSEKFGTVGVAVLDKHGNLAAGTSTGGMMMKEFGRIGDSPIIGAGTYADNNGCAVSCTGHGEFFIRYAVAHSLSSRVAQGEDIGAAADDILYNTLLPVEGMGGLVAVDKNGQVAMSFNTPGMFRAYAQGDSSSVAIFK